MQVSPECDERIKPCDEPVHIPETSRIPLAERLLDLSQIAPGNGNLNPYRIDGGSVANHPEILSALLETQSFLLVPKSPEHKAAQANDYDHWLENLRRSVIASSEMVP